MNETQAREQDVHHTVAELSRTDGGRLLSLLIAKFRRFDLAEEALQEAMTSALAHWGRSGLPSNPSAWLFEAARRKAIDRLRRERTQQGSQGELEYLQSLSQDDGGAEPDAIPDERLKLIFTCCHPALERQASVALTLRSLCGLTTEEIAHAFLTSRETMAQRLVRARQKISKAGIPYVVPEPEHFAERLQSVLAVIYLIFNEGYSAARAEGLRLDLCAEAQRLVEVLTALLPDEPEVCGLACLMALHTARFATRLDQAGVPVPLDAQDRSQWDHAVIVDAGRRLQAALRLGRPGPYQLQAAIAALHAEAPSFVETDWREIVLIYNRIQELAPNPVILLNRQVALSYAVGPAVALEGLAVVADDLASYQPYHAVRADLFLRNGQLENAHAAFEAALTLTRHEGEKRFLERRLAQVKVALPTSAR